MTTTTTKTTKPRATKDYACQECGHRMTLAQAERAARNVQGCPKCGGADIDLAP
jgi:predicted nucleic acid-binding Zn ribbon protein